MTKLKKGIKLKANGIEYILSILLASLGIVLYSLRYIIFPIYEASYAIIWWPCLVSLITLMLFCVFKYKIINFLILVFPYSVVTFNLFSGIIINPDQVFYPSSIQMEILFIILLTHIVYSLIIIFKNIKEHLK